MIQAQQSKQVSPSFVTARLFDFIDLHPSRIQHMSYNNVTRKLYVARKDYSEVYSVHASQNAKNVSIEQIMVFEPCEQIYEIDGLIVLVLPFELKVNYLGKWIIYPFTTQLLPQNTKVHLHQNKLYTFFINQCRVWTISQDDGIDVKHLPKNQMPYYITIEGALEGFGKKIKPNNFKDNKFTIAQMSTCGKYLFVGSDKGHLHIYQTKYLTHLKTFHRHEGAILSIVQRNGICYFTGSDSKISSIVIVNDDWVLSKQVRAQSHDIFALGYLELGQKQNYLASGGITTDVCVYKLSESGVMTDQFSHKISYSSEKLSYYINNYIVVNKKSNFQIWKVGSPEQNKKAQIELLVQYQMPFYKCIKQMLVKQESSSIIVFVSTQQEANLWSFEEEGGLKKLLTVKNNYNVSQWYKKDFLITIRDGNKLQLFNYRTGHIKQLAQTQINYPTDLKLNSKGDKLIIGSKFSKRISVHKFLSQKICKVVGAFQIQQTYNVIDFCYYNTENIIIKFSNQNFINEYDSFGNLVSNIVKLPIVKVRDFGWLAFPGKDKNKIFWYAVSQGKVVLVSRMRTNTKIRKIRVKQMPRIGNVVIQHSQINKCGKLQFCQNNWDLGIIPLNFEQMISKQIKPIITKKIL